MQSSLPTSTLAALAASLLFVAGACEGDSGGGAARAEDARVSPDADDATDAPNAPDADDADDAPDAPDAPDAEPRDAEVTADAEPPPAGPFRWRGTLEQVYVWLAPPETPVELVSGGGEVVAEASTDAQGSLVFRRIPPAAGYTVRLRDAPEEAVADVEVRAPEELVAEPGLYDQ